MCSVFTEGIHYLVIFLMLNKTKLTCDTVACPRFFLSYVVIAESLTYAVTILRCPVMCKTDHTDFLFKLS